MLQRAGVVALLILYLYGLDRMGLYGPDEPRYASIGREMAHTGDCITPRLWGQPWFEKPPLLYWMVAAGFRAGLSPDLAPRIPVALLSVAFLLTFCFILCREFGRSAAVYSTVILATSAGWIALSEVAVTDLPMAAMFGFALLFLLPWLRTGNRACLNAAAVSLGLAFLAKSGPPLVLSLPALWFGRERWRDLVRPTPWLLFLLVAAPWHIACYMRNGPVFVRTLFLQHQIARFISPDLQHVQHWWFYIPLLPAAFAPWTPALALLLRRDLYSDNRLRLLLATAVWGLVFFSASTNKLPTYLLPLLPPIAVLAGVALERAPMAGRIVIGLSALSLSPLPILVTMLPIWMSRNPRAAFPDLQLPLTLALLIAAAGISLVRNRMAAVMAAAFLAAAGYLWIKVEALPYVDRAATARPVWRQLENSASTACVKPEVPRDLRYQLNYYSDQALPDCGAAASRGAEVNYVDRELSVTR